MWESERGWAQLATRNDDEDCIHLMPYISFELVARYERTHNNVRTLHHVINIWHMYTNTISSPFFVVLENTCRLQASLANTWIYIPGYYCRQICPIHIQQLVPSSPNELISMGDDNRPRVKWATINHHHHQHLTNWIELLIFSVFSSSIVVHNLGFYY